MRSLTPEQQAHLRFVRRHVPEPTRIEADSIPFIWPDDYGWASAFSCEEITIPSNELRRILFIEGRTKYWAWSYDGKTPLFPEWDL